jgi:D-glycero-D-manno-heptose 1,7-bisphosphate phosphatase
MIRRPAVFLDRDGTLNRERGFVTRPEELEVFPWVAGALRWLQHAGFVLVVVTNQSGVARGVYTEDDLARIHDKLNDELPDLLAAIYHCPHHPEGTVAAFAGDCDCRKPKPGMVLRAARDLELDLGRSFIVGDAARDVLVARGLPLRTVLVSGSPGSAAAALADIEKAGERADHVADDVASAAVWILSQRGG